MPIVFKKMMLDSAPFEACSVFDVNNDGVKDIVCGTHWYEGPDFLKKHKICDVDKVERKGGTFHDDFCDYPLDVNGDGYMDIITGSWFSKKLRWRRNPGVSGGIWETIVIDEYANIETIRFWDIDGCGTPEIFPNTPDSPQVFYKLICDEQGRGTGRFFKTTIYNGVSGHGLGFADINGDGRTDVILAGGWLEQPEDSIHGTWTFHPEFDLGSASIPILGHDINGDGLVDLIVGQAHDYGLHWYEQKITARGTRSWVKHDIDMTVSQYHDLQLVDLDHDGELELVAGKRYKAHDIDPGAEDPLGIYYFKIRNGQFEKHTIDYGPAGEASGNGIFMWIEDVTGNGYPDIAAPGKEGLFLFENLGIRSE